MRKERIGNERQRKKKMIKLCFKKFGRCGKKKK